MGLRHGALVRLSRLIFVGGIDIVLFMRETLIHPSAKWLVGMIMLMMLLTIPAVIEIRYPLILPYLWHKVLHIVGVVLLMSNILATPLWVSMVNREKNPAILHSTTNLVNWADVIFTGPGLLLIIYNGLTLAGRLGGIYKTSWITVGFLLMALILMIWIGFLVRYQQRMYSLSKKSVDAKEALPDEFYILLKKWTFWGRVAVVLPIVSIIVMVVKPKLW